MTNKLLLRDVIQASLEFHERRLWKRFSNRDCFAIRVSGVEHPLFACVMGAGGEQYGLLLFRGEHAATVFSVLAYGAGPDDEDADEADMLGFNREAFGGLSPEHQAFFREAGVHPRHDELVPDFLVRPAHRNPRLPHQAELALLLLVLKGLMAADRRKLLKSGGLDHEDGVCCVTLAGDPSNPSVTARRERLPNRSASTPPIAAATFAGDLRGLKRLETTWLVGTPLCGSRIENDDRSVRLLLIVDDASDLILHASPVFSVQIEEAAEQLVDTFRAHPPGGRSGVPRRIIFSSSKLYGAMAPALQKLGVTCTYSREVPKLQSLALGFQEFMNDGGSPGSEQSEPAASHEVEVPAPDDLAGWKQADRRLSQRFSAIVREGTLLRSPRAVRRYFDDDDLDSFLSRHKQRSVAVAYALWCVLDYRPHKSSPTEAEKMLAEGLPPAEALLLRARMEAAPSVYRVAGHDPACGTVELEDVLVGDAVTVHDQLLSENVQDSWFLVVRVFPAGRFHFIDLAGPPLGMGMGLEAVNFLRDCDLQFTPAGLKRGAHKLGWLWGWIDAWEANSRPPQLCNTDGDSLLLHTASFAVADPQATRRALLNRADIGYDKDEDEFRWFRETGKGAELLGESISLGRIQFVGDELVLSVNSTERFETARRWLLELPGVTFRNAVTEDMDSLTGSRPPDETISQSPPEVTPETAAAVQEMLDRQSMQWIDTPLPVLGGKTPREACGTRSGREQVTLLIRTMPDPIGPVPIRVPRQAMLRELGLEA